MSRYLQYLRTGDQSNTVFETILANLNKARGTAYSSYQDEDTSSLVYVENLAYAKAIAEIYNTNERMKNQFDPNKMSFFVSRWNRIFGLTPDYDDTLEQQKAVLALKFALLTKRSINVELENLCRAYLGIFFVEIIHDTSNTNQGSIGPNEFSSPLTISGGVTLPANTSWFSALSHIIIRCWQPRTYTGAILDNDSEYDRRITKLSTVLDNFLPAYVEVSFMRYYKESAQNIFKIGFDLSNGYFDPFPGNWASESNATLTRQTYDTYYALRFAPTVPVDPQAQVRNNLGINNRQYRITGEYRCSHGTVIAALGFKTGTSYTLGSATSWTSFDITALSNTSSSFLITGTVMPTTGHYIEIRNLTVEKLHMTDGNMEMSGLLNAGQVVWVAANAYTTVTKSTENPRSGTQCLKVETTNNSSVKGARQSHFATGDSYIIRGYARGDGVIAPKVFVYQSLSSAYVPVWTGTTSTNWQYFQLPISLGLGSVILGNNDAIAGSVYFDDVYMDDMFLDDADMEFQYMDYWTPYGGGAASKSTTYVNSGFRSLRLTSNGPTQGVTNTCTLIVGNKYTIEGWWRTDGAGAIPAVQNGSNYLVANSIDSGSSYDRGWTFFSWTFVATSAFLSFYNAASITGTSYIYIDDLVMYTHLLKSIDSTRDLTVNISDDFKSDDIEVVDDYNNPQIYTIQLPTTALKSAVITTYEPIKTNVTNQKYRKLGFYLDEPNLDKHCFSNGDITP